MGSRRRAPSLAQQAFALTQRFPDGRVRRTGSTLTWRGELTPTPLSRTYLIEITFRVRKRPVVRVLKPELESRLGETLPHVWDHTRRVLCLHESKDWDPTMLLADTTVPWTAEWLIFYEIWLVTGEWGGGGDWTPVRTSECAA